MNIIQKEKQEMLNYNSTIIIPGITRDKNFHGGCGCCCNNLIKICKRCEYFKFDNKPNLNTEDKWKTLSFDRSFESIIDINSLLGIENQIKIKYENKFIKRGFLQKFKDILSPNVYPDESKLWFLKEIFFESIEILNNKIAQVQFLIKNRIEDHKKDISDIKKIVIFSIITIIYYKNQIMLSIY